MSAPLFLLEPGSLAGVGPGDRVVLDGPEGRHAATVRRTRVEEVIDVADGCGALARCRVLSVQPAALELVVQDRTDLPLPTPRFVLVQALAKRDRDDLAIEAATELGIDEVAPWQAARSIVQWRGDRVSKGQRQWEQTVRAAAKQSRRPRIPAVAGLLTTSALCERLRSAALAVVLHEDAGEPLVGVQVPTAGEVLLIVGPEGGISPDEVSALVDAGAVTCRLGREVLRSSTAGPAALSVLSAAVRWR